MSLGPFDIGADRIQALGTRFTPFVNRLLELEVAANTMRGWRLSINSNETTPDGGVDAALSAASETDYLPEGSSAWQFKRTNFGPKQCADELEGAAWAHEYIRAGGSYILVVGHPLPDKNVEERRKLIAAKAVELELLEKDDPSRIRVYDANRLAGWSSTFPALAVSKLSGGPGSDAVDFETWSAGQWHTTQWVPDDRRQELVELIRQQLADPEVTELRVQGDSGNGKSRLVLEALRSGDLSPLVAYVSDERAVAGELLNHLLTDGRSAILVVDECPAERHVKLAERIPPDPTLRLITIGEGGPALSRVPVIGLDGLSPETYDEFLKVNYTSLPPEHRRFVADHSRGNPRWMMVLAERVKRLDKGRAADLIGRNDIEAFVTELLPEGHDYFCSAVLALLDRVGWDGELRYQAELLASFAGVEMSDLESAEMSLAGRGLITQQGRYRVIAPHPLAVFLANEAWSRYAERLTTELLPKLDEPMTLAFFRRTADLGNAEPARTELQRLLSPDGAFGSLELISERSAGRALTQLAIVMPEEVAQHLSELVSDRSLDQLRSLVDIRRDLVWTLEKLAWHSRTFEQAADTLLRLALAENESFGNNATGTWTGLFATVLPGTAARPSPRSDYLERKALSSDPAVRRLVVDAARSALTHHESALVSGEIQGGSLVEPRGTPETWDQAGDYRGSAIEVLRQLSSDEDADVSFAAQDALISAVHPMIADPFCGDRLTDALVSLEGQARNRLRSEVEHLIHLKERHPRNDGVLKALRRLTSRLPSPTPLETIRVLSSLRRWDFLDGELRDRMMEAVENLGTPERRREALVAVLSEPELPAAWELGHAAGRMSGDDSTLRAVFDARDRHPDGLLGFLQGRVASGATDTFEDFLDGPLGQEISLHEQAAYAARSPNYEAQRKRINSALKNLDVATGTQLAFSLHRSLSYDDVAQLLTGWKERLASQDDYNALLDWLQLAASDLEGEDTGDLRDAIWDVVQLRASFPSAAHERYEWSQLAAQFVEAQPGELGKLIIDLVEQENLMLLEDSYESGLLTSCAEKDPELVREILSRVEAGSWLLQVELRGWLLEHVDPAWVEAWIGGDLERARLVASLAPIGDEVASSYVQFLLREFADDDRVKGSLYSSLVSGFWTGNESDRIQGQIDQLTAWRKTYSDNQGLREWAREAIASLQENRKSALLREAEDDRY